jgi:hypothetical protein
MPSMSSELQGRVKREEKSRRAIVASQHLAVISFYPPPFRPRAQLVCLFSRVLGGESKIYYFSMLFHNHSTDSSRGALSDDNSEYTTTAKMLRDKNMSEGVRVAHKTGRRRGGWRRITAAK